MEFRDGDSEKRSQGILHLSDEERQKLLASIKELEDAHRRNLSKSSLLNWQKWRAAEKKLLDQEHQKQARPAAAAAGSLWVRGYRDAGTSREKPRTPNPKPKP